MHLKITDQIENEVNNLIINRFFFFLNERETFTRVI